MKPTRKQEVTSLFLLYIEQSSEAGLEQHVELCLQFSHNQFYRELSKTLGLDYRNLSDSRQPRFAVRLPQRSWAAEQGGFD